MFFRFCLPSYDEERMKALIIGFSLLTVKKQRKRHRRAEKKQIELQYRNSDHSEESMILKIMRQRST
jgi:hypothetical protein